MLLPLKGLVTVQTAVKSDKWIYQKSLAVCSYKLCDPVCQVSNDLISPLDTQSFLVPTSTLETCFEKSGLDQNEAKYARDMGMLKVLTENVCTIRL